MLKYSFETLKGMETIDNDIDYARFSNHMDIGNNFWISGVVQSKVATWSSSMSICLRFFDKAGNNMAGVSLWPGDILFIDEHSGHLEVKKQHKNL